MAVPTLNFTTGPTTLPDIGRVSYNGCVFGPLFETNVSGSVVQDDARRTTKYMEYTITVDGYVTLPAGFATVAPVMEELRNLLTAHAGLLEYRGRGCDIVINPAGGINERDVAWGPVPKLLEFQPLGGGRSAKVRWQVTTRISELLAKEVNLVNKFPGKQGFAGLAGIPLLQFNYESSVTYSEDGFSNLSVKGVLEIPLTRTPGQGVRTLQQTADELRDQIESRVTSSIDLSRFRITKRDFSLSRDKRTLTWDFNAEEKSYMDIPPDCTIARGNFSVRTAKAGLGLVTWLCTLRCTYTVRNDRPRRTAWLAFLALLRERMAYSSFAPDIPVQGGNQNPNRKILKIAREIIDINPLEPAFLSLIPLFKKQNKKVTDSRKAWLMDLTFDEGLYIDSKTIVFSATWRLNCMFSHILLASGLWVKLKETDAQGRNLWSTSMANVQGANSWLTNRADPSLDVIVDFGG